MVLFSALLGAAILMTIAGYVAHKTVLSLTASGFWILFAGSAYLLKTGSDIYWMVFFFAIFVAIEVGITGAMDKDKDSKTINKIYLQKETGPKRKRIADEDLFESENDDDDYKSQTQMAREHMDSVKSRNSGTIKRIKRRRKAEKLDRSGLA